MKKNNIVIYLSELLLLIYIIIFKTIFLKYLNAYIDIANILVFSILTALVYVFLGFQKRRKLIDYNAIQTISICFIVYYFLTYLFGMFFGFLSNAYSLKILNIIKNITVALVIYGLKEIYRYIVVKKTEKNYMPIILLTILLAVLDIIMEINAYDLNTGSGIFEFVEAVILPKTALSFILSYISYKFNYKLAILFLILYDLPKYFLPIFPDMGIYIDSMVRLVFIFCCYYQLSILMEKYERKITIARSYGKKSLMILIVVPILILVGLVSGIFKYHLFAIGSNSMLPYFSRGDAVLIEKLDNEELKKIKVDDVIAFHYNNQILVHRVVSINEVNGNYKIKTKGDNNDYVDAWTVSNEDVYGKVKNVIKYIGIPSVELSELMD